VVFYWSNRWDLLGPFGLPRYQLETPAQLEEHMSDEEHALVEELDDAPDPAAPANLVGVIGLTFPECAPNVL
jgi:hypothetical protein